MSVLVVLVLGLRLGMVVVVVAVGTAPPRQRYALAPCLNLKGPHVFPFRSVYWREKRWPRSCEAAETGAKPQPPSCCCQGWWFQFACC